MTLALGMTSAGLLPLLWLREPTDTWLPREGDTCELRDVTLPNPSCQGPEFLGCNGGCP